MLVSYAFRVKLLSFRFELERNQSSLHRKLPLDISLLALLVEASLYDAKSDTNEGDGRCYARRVIRGQNLDRAGLSAKHMKILNALAEPKDEIELAEALGWETSELRRVLNGFVRAELLEQKTQTVPGQFVVFEPDANAAQHLRTTLDASDMRYAGKVVRDKLALQLVFKRAVPHTVFFSVDDAASCELMSKLFSSNNPKAATIKKVGLSADPQTTTQREALSEKLGFCLDGIVSNKGGAETLFQCMDRLFSATDSRPKEKMQTTSEPGVALARSITAASVVESQAPSELLAGGHR
jgi:hypothetical protein